MAEERGRVCQEFRATGRQKKRQIACGYHQVQSEDSGDYPKSCPRGLCEVSIESPYVSVFSIVLYYAFVCISTP